MTSKKIIENFLSEKNIAVVGVSGSGKKFGYTIYKELKSKGYNVYPVNPNAANIDGEKCYPSLLALQGKVKAAILVVPPSATKEVVKDAYSMGIKKIWMQQGSESEEAISYCKEVGIDVIHNECVLMFAEPAAFFHRAHRWISGVVGKLPR
ncbi:MAG: CoA-binding protein [Ignavibacteria bacterium]|nr:CoA-binding protein [Ignavibacteria bacterium]